MVELYEKQINELEDLEDIADILTRDEQYTKNILKYINNPCDADVEKVGKGIFTIGISKAESPSLDTLDPATALTRANNEAMAKLACSGARFLTAKNVSDRRINAMGLFKSKKNIIPMSFESKGDTIYLVGNVNDDSEYEITSDTLHALVKCAEKEFITSAHYISSNGLFVSLVECCAPNNLGFDITGDGEIEDKEFLFGLSKYVAIVTVTEEQENDFVDFLYDNDIPVTLLGHVTKGELRLDELVFGHITDYLPE